MHIYRAVVKRWDKGEKKLLKNFSPFQKRLWHVWMFLIRFYAFTFPLYVFVNYTFEGSAIQTAVATLLSGMLSLSGVKTVLVNSATFNLPDYGWYIEIIRDCVGWKSSLALAGLMLAVRNVSLKTKARGIIASVPLIFFANLLRIYTSILLSVWVGVEHFPFIHDVLWQSTMAVLTLGLWLFWLKEHKLHPLFGAQTAKSGQLSKAEINSLKLFISRKF